VSSRSRECATAFGLDAELSAGVEQLMTRAADRLGGGGHREVGY
jgi:hypothetical protein